MMTQSGFLRRIAALILCASVAQGCRASEETSGGETAGSSSDFLSGVEAYDSVGARIVVTPGEIARAPFPWRVDPEPYFRVGRVEGEQPYLFDGIRGVARLSDGTVLVVDEGSRELRVFDQRGVFQRIEGGQGRGPGEFEVPLLVPTPATDSILIYDQRTGRFTIYDGNARNPQVLRFDEAGLVTPVGAAGEFILSRSPRIPFDPRDEPEGLYFDSYTVKWIRLASGTVVGDSLHFDGPGMLRVPRRASWSLPFQVANSVAVAAAGFFVTSGSRPEIGQYDSDGRLQRVLRIEETPIPVSEGEFQTALEASITPAARRFNFAEMGPHAFGRLSQPVVVPSFDALRVDDDGWLWARIYEVGTQLGRPFDDGRNEWIVFDPYGRARGTVELPAGLEVSEIGSDYILGLRRSELEVEIVEGYRLTRRLGVITR